MPIVIVLLIAILVAQVGFWDTLSAILGSLLMLALLIILAVALVMAAAYLLRRRMSSRWRGGR